MEFSYSFRYDTWQDEYDTVEEALDALTETFDGMDRPLDKYLDFGSYENRVDAINNQRPLFEDVLASDTLAPQGLVLLERMVTETPSRFKQRDTENLHFRGRQITSVNDQRIMELAESEDPEVAGRALRLMYTAAEKLYSDSQAPFLTGNFSRFAWNAAQNPYLELHNPKYAAEALISCVTSQDRSIAASAIRTAHDVMYAPETTGFGATVYEGLIAYAFKSDKVFGARQETIDLYKTRPELLDYKLRLGDYLRRLNIRDAKQDDSIEILLDVDAFYTEAKADPDMTEAFKRSVGVYVAQQQYAKKPSVLYERWMRITGHSYSTYIRAWNGGCGDKMRPQNYEDRNIEAMAAIELIEPGAVKVLTEEFGIRNFMRYPTRTMINQYRNRDNKDLEYGVYIMPRTDHNGAFHPSNGHSHLIEAFERGLEQVDAGMRIYEVNTMADAVRAALEARHKYEKRLRFAVIGGHGTSNTLEFDSADIYEGYMRSTHIRRVRERSADRMMDIFADDAIIVLDSCSTGKQDGLMDDLSELLDLTSFAPVSPTKLDSIEVESGDLPGSFAIRPIYRDPGVMASSLRFRKTK